MKNSKLKISILRWTAYWLAVILIYVALSIYFGSYIYYAMLLVRKPSLWGTTTSTTWE